MSEQGHEALRCRTYSETGADLCDRPARFIVWGHLYDKRDKGPKCGRHLPPGVLLPSGFGSPAIYEIPDAPVAAGATVTREITLPRPVVPFGPNHKPENEATADYLWEAARRIGDSRMFGSNLTRTVSDLLAAASHAVREDVSVDDGRPAVVRPDEREG